MAATSSATTCSTATAARPPDRAPPGPGPGLRRTDSAASRQLRRSRPWADRAAARHWAPAARSRFATPDRAAGSPTLRSGCRSQSATGARASRPDVPKQRAVATTAPRRARDPAELGDQPALADAGLPAHQDGLRSPPGRVLPERSQLPELVRAPDQAARRVT